MSDTQITLPQRGQRVWGPILDKAMEDILGAANNGQRFAQDNDPAGLQTVDKSSLVAAINEIRTAIAEIEPAELEPVDERIAGVYVATAAENIAAIVPPLPAGTLIVRLP